MWGCFNSSFENNLVSRRHIMWNPVPQRCLGSLHESPEMQQGNTNPSILPGLSVGRALDPLAVDLCSRKFSREWAGTIDM